MMTTICGETDTDRRTVNSLCKAKTRYRCYEGVVNMVNIDVHVDRLPGQQRNFLKWATAQIRGRRM